MCEYNLDLYGGVFMACLQNGVGQRQNFVNDIFFLHLLSVNDVFNYNVHCMLTWKFNRLKTDLFIW